MPWTGAYASRADLRRAKIIELHSGTEKALYETATCLHRGFAFNSSPARRFSPWSAVNVARRSDLYAAGLESEPFMRHRVCHGPAISSKPGRRRSALCFPAARRGARDRTTLPPLPSLPGTSRIRRGAASMPCWRCWPCWRPRPCTSPAGTRRGRCTPSSPGFGRWSLRSKPIGCWDPNWASWRTASRRMSPLSRTRNMPALRGCRHRCALTLRPWPVTLARHCWRHHIHA